jgi:uncharacterized membrane protein
MRNALASTVQPVDRLYRLFPIWGGLLCLLVLIALLALPLIVVDGYWHALRRLHLSHTVGVLVLLAILVGSWINLSLWRVPRDDFQVVLEEGWPGWLNRTWTAQPSPFETQVVLNLGGCAVPALLACYEVAVCLSGGSHVMVALVIAIFASVITCRATARIVPGAGIIIPALLPAMVAVGSVWLFLPSSGFETFRAPVAFVAGVAGPLIGADLLLLPEIKRTSAAVVSIGGAGTFDGIVLSGMLAALLA